MKDYNPNNAKELSGRGNTEAALKVLETKANDDNDRNEVILLASRNNTLEKQYRQGLINEREYQYGKTIINNSALSLSDKIESPSIGKIQKSIPASVFKHRDEDDNSHELRTLSIKLCELVRKIQDLAFINKNQFQRIASITTYIPKRLSSSDYSILVSKYSNKIQSLITEIEQALRDNDNSKFKYFSSVIDNLLEEINRMQASI